MRKDLEKPDLKPLKTFQKLSVASEEITDITWNQPENNRFKNLERLRLNVVLR